MVNNDNGTLEPVRCPVCKSDDGLELDERSSAGKKLRSVICRRCSHVYLNPRARQETYDEFYRSGFSLEFNKIDDRESLVALADSNKAKTARLLKFIAPYIRPGMRVLEIGAGYGNVLAALRDDYQVQEVVGIEPDPIGQKVAHEVFGLELLPGVLSEHVARLSDGKFDLIIMHHVLEHFLEPDEVGDALRRLCAVDGAVYIGVPNICALTVPRKMYFRFPHVQYFSPFSLFLFLRRNGLKVVAHGPFDQPLTVVAMPFGSTAAQATSWEAAIKTSVPYEKVVSQVKRGHLKQSLRLFVRDRLKPMIPKKIKLVLKKMIH